jgi:hypothetical protein
LRRMIWLLLLICTFLGCYRLAVFRENPLHPLILFAIFLLKITVGGMLVWIYTFYYTDPNSADIYKYLNDAKYIHKGLSQNTIGYLKVLSGTYGSDFELCMLLRKTEYWYLYGSSNLINDGRLMIRYHLLLLPLTGGKIFTHLLLLNFWAFAGQTALCNLFVKIRPNHRIEAVIAAYLIPSVLFWTSGMLKEGMLIGFFGFLLYSLHAAFTRFRIASLFGIAVFGTGLFFSKFYVLILLVASLPVLFFLKLFQNRNLAYLLMLLFYAGAYFLTQPRWIGTIIHKQHEFNNATMGNLFVKSETDTFRADIDLARPLMRTFAGDTVTFSSPVLVKRFVNLADADTTHLLSEKKYVLLMITEKAGSWILIPACNAHPGSFLGHAPEYLFNALLRPNLREVKNTMQWMPAMENILMTLLFAFVVLFHKKIPLPDMEVYFWFFAIFLLLTAGSVTPVLGALVRYKVPALPLLWWSLFCRAKKILPFGQDS